MASTEMAASQRELEPHLIAYLIEINLTLFHSRFNPFSCNWFLFSRRFLTESCAEGFHSFGTSLCGVEWIDEDVDLGQSGKKKLPLHREGPAQ